MRSSILTGWVVHHRFSPKKHSFKYPVCYFFIKLSQRKRLFRTPLLFSYNQWGIISFRDKNYLGLGVGDLELNVKDKILKFKGKTFDGEIYILTQLSYFGFCFNPVTFYYCYEHDQLAYVVAEINNTPWDERFSYVLDTRDLKGEKFQKKFHVSPFFPMNLNCSWNFSVSDNNFSIKMKNFNQNLEQVFFANLDLKASEINFWNIVRSFFFYPLMGISTLVRIYYQAFILWIKGIPFYTHPDKISKQVGGL